MAAEQVLSAEDRRLLVERRLDELDRVLLGLLPRAERLAIVASVEARVQALGDDVVINRETLAEVPVATVANSGISTSTRGRRSRLAFSSGVLGIVVASCLVGSPLLLVALSIFGELLGETFSILLFGLLTALITFGGGLAVLCGGISLLRLARRGQTTTGTGWAITGLCTGALPLLIGFVAVLTLGAQFLPAEHVQVTWHAGPGGPPPTLPGEPPGYPVAGPAMIPAGEYAAAPYPKEWDRQPAPQLPDELLPARSPVEPAVKPERRTEVELEIDLLPRAKAEPVKEPVELED